MLEIISYASWLEILQYRSCNIFFSYQQNIYTCTDKISYLLLSESVTTGLLLHSLIFYIQVS